MLAGSDNCNDPLLDLFEANALEASNTANPRIRLLETLAIFTTILFFPEKTSGTGFGGPCSRRISDPSHNRIFFEFVRRESVAGSGDRGSTCWSAQSSRAGERCEFRDAEQSAYCGRQRNRRGNRCFSGDPHACVPFIPENRLGCFWQRICFAGISARRVHHQTSLAYGKAIDRCSRRRPIHPWAGVHDGDVYWLSDGGNPRGHRCDRWNFSSWISAGCAQWADDSQASELDSFQRGAKRSGCRVACTDGSGLLAIKSRRDCGLVHPCRLFAQPARAGTLPSEFRVVDYWGGASGLVREGLDTGRGRTFLHRREWREEFVTRQTGASGDQCGDRPSACARRASSGQTWGEAQSFAGLCRSG